MDAPKPEMSDTASELVTTAASLINAIAGASGALEHINQLSAKIPALTCRGAEPRTQALTVMQVAGECLIMLDALEYDALRDLCDDDADPEQWTKT